MDTSSASTPVGGVDMTIRLPDGVQVDTAADGTGRIPATALSTGSAISGSSPMVGRYISSSHSVHLSLTTAAAKAWSGEFARLKISIPTATTATSLTETALLTTVGERLAGFQVVGLTATPRSTVSLADQVKTAVALLR